MSLKVSSKCFVFLFLVPILMKNPTCRVQATRRSKLYFRFIWMNRVLVSRYDQMTISALTDSFKLDCWKGWWARLWKWRLIRQWWVPFHSPSLLTHVALTICRLNWNRKQSGLLRPTHFPSLFILYKLYHWVPRKCIYVRFTFKFQNLGPLCLE